MKHLIMIIAFTSISFSQQRNDLIYQFGIQGYELVIVSEQDSITNFVNGNLDSCFVWEKNAVEMTAEATETIGDQSKNIIYDSSKIYSHKFKKTNIQHWGMERSPLSSQSGAEYWWKREDSKMKCTVCKRVEHHTIFIHDRKMRTE